MARLLGLIAAILLLAGPALGQERTLTILSVNDTHSNLDASGPKDANLDGTVGGLVKAAPVIAAELAAAEPNAVFLHAGDLFMGDSYFFAFHGVPELQVLEQLGLDAMVVGNHELWYPPCLMLGPVWAASGVTFPLLGANVVTGACTEGIAPVIAPRTELIEAGDVQVGVVGLTTPFDLIANMNATIGGAGQTPEQVVATLIQLAGPEVRALRDAGAEVVILLTHLPAALDEALARFLPVDAVVGGHDHHELAATVASQIQSGKLVPVVHAGAYYRKLGKVVLSVGEESVSVQSAELLAVDQRVPRLPAAQNPVAALVAQLQALVPVMLPGAFDPADPFHTQIPFAFAEKNVSNELNMRVPKRDTGTGNLVTDALRMAGETQLAFTVTGQTPQGIAAGPVVQEDLLRMVGVGLDSTPLPRIARAEVTGGAILQAIETTIAAALQDDDFILQVSGMRYVYDSSLPLGQRIVSVEIGDQPLVEADVYSVTMNALLFQMLGVLDIPIVEDSGEVLEISEFEAIRDYVAGLGTFIYAGENRVRDLAVQRGKRQQ